MRIIHTGDWHLGLTFHGYSRLTEQALFLDELLQTLRAVDADALLVAGDVFDTFAPPTAAQELFYSFLHKAQEQSPHLQIVITAGNHDSGLRLEAPRELLAPLNIHIRGSVWQGAEHSIDYQQFAIPLHDRAGNEYLCLAIPFLRISDCPQDGAGTPPTTAFYRELYETFRDDPRPTICMGHLYASGATIDEHDDVEYNIIGGLDGLALEPYLSDYSYVALGHIHLHQRVYSTGNIYYSGAPIATSFAQHQRRHGYLVVDLEPQGTQVTLHEFVSPLELRKIAGTYEDIARELLHLTEGVPDDLAPILSLEIRTDAPLPNLKQDLERWLTNRYARLGSVQLQSLSPENKNPELELTHFYHSLDPERIADIEYQKQFHNPMPAPLQALLRDAIQATRECGS